MRLPRLLGALALLAALPAHGSIRALMQEPRSGDVLRGGSTATIAWSAADLPRYAEEWEAFLSVDGGGFYAYRLTPHLSIEQRRFTFEVPNVATEHARILIRAGDERKEVEIELPAVFAIEQDRAKAIAGGTLTVDDDERGESARAGEPGVLAWVDGDRGGRHLRQRSAFRHEKSLYGVPRLHDDADAAEAGAIAILVTLSNDAEPLLRENDPQPVSYVASRDVLLACRRLNV